MLRKKIQEEFIRELRRDIHIWDWEGNNREILIVGDTKYPWKYIKIEIPQAYNRVKKKILYNRIKKIDDKIKELDSLPTGIFTGPAGVKGLAISAVLGFGLWVGLYDYMYQYTPIIAGYMVLSGLLLTLDNLGAWPIKDPTEIEVERNHYLKILRNLEEMYMEDARLTKIEIVENYEIIKIEFKKIRGSRTH